MSLNDSLGTQDGGDKKIELSQLLGSRNASKRFD